MHRRCTHCTNGQTDPAHGAGHLRPSPPAAHSPSPSQPGSRYRSAHCCTQEPARTIFSLLLTMYPPPLTLYYPTLHTTDKPRPTVAPTPPTSDSSTHACTEHVAHRAVSIAYHRARPSRAINEAPKKNPFERSRHPTQIMCPSLLFAQRDHSLRRWQVGIS